MVSINTHVHTQMKIIFLSVYFGFFLHNAKKNWVILQSNEDVRKRLFLQIKINALKI